MSLKKYISNNEFNYTSLSGNKYNVNDEYDHIFLRRTYKI